MNLITGSTGLVGSHLLYSLLIAGKQVKVLIRNIKDKEKIALIFKYYIDKPEELLKKVDWVYGDVRNKYLLGDIFSDVKYVYHCAAKVSFARKDKQEMLDVNILGTANIVNYCLQFKVKKLVFVSSIAAIGKPLQGNIYSENCEWPQGKLSTYSYSKTHSELEVWRGIAEGLNAVIICPSVILGPGNWEAGSGKIFKQVYKGMKFFTRGVTGFVDVRDVAHLMVFLMEHDISAERYIVNAENISYEKVLKTVANALGVKSPSYYAPSFLTSIAWMFEAVKAVLTFQTPLITKQSAKTSHDIQRYSSEKLIKAIGFKFIPIEQSIADTARKFLLVQSSKFKV
jgi:nucleoside-diphosphate-sugar epimerase